MVRENTFSKLDFFFLPCYFILHFFDNVYVITRKQGNFKLDSGVVLYSTNFGINLSVAVVFSITFFDFHNIW
jgi:hypothetical protein